MDWNIAPAKAAVRQCLRLFIASVTVLASKIKTALAHLPRQSRQPGLGHGFSSGRIS
jgi:hypothetical protein